MPEKDVTRPPGKTPGSGRLDSLYNADYFYGKTSGYPAEGYARSHPDWTPWLDLTRQIVPGGRLLDLGCAYGYLVGEARARGFSGYGLDISSYALARQQELQPYLVRADLASLPLRDHCADVVCLFDVLEHLENPLMALQESVRVLAPEGLLTGTTPDPLHFSGEEETHVFERPPSFWIGALRELGLEVGFRFSVEPFNFQFVAAREGTSTAAKLKIFQHDYFTPAPDFIDSQGGLELVPRHGWGRLAEDSRQLVETPASLYLLNGSDSPQRCRLKFQLRHPGCFGTLRIRLGSLVSRQVVLTSAETVIEVELPEFVVSAGGHHLYFEMLTPDPGEILVGPLKARSQPASRKDVVERLPFDLYQRYRFAAQSIEVLGPKSLLDVGGYLGDASGHLATTADFVGALPDPPEIIRTTDLRQGDFPHHTPASAWNQPFSDQSFDLVMSLDLLEHLDPARRSDFLEELNRLARAWILLGAPFASPEVVEAEEALAGGLMRARPFLQEHRQLGLPETDQVRAFFEQRGYRVLSFPNGYLHRWTAVQALTQFFFSLNDAPLFEEFNRLYNLECYRHDQSEPGYRTILLACRQPLPPDREQALRKLVSEPTTHSLESLLLGKPAFLQLQQRVLELMEERTGHWRDTQFLINERQKLIGLQSREIAALRQELEHTPLWRLARRRWKQKGEQ